MYVQLIMDLVLQSMPQSNWMWNVSEKNLREKIVIFETVSSLPFLDAPSIEQGQTFIHTR